MNETMEMTQHQQINTDMVNFYTSGLPINPKHDFSHLKQTLIFPKSKCLFMLLSPSVVVN